MSSTLHNSAAQIPPDPRPRSEAPVQAARCPEPASSRAGLDPRRSIPQFSFRRTFRPNPSSSGIASSIAEGRPIPVDDTTAKHRTSALRELSNNYPSRHRYAESTGAKSSTNSEPVIVRSYYSPMPSRSETSSRRSGAIVHQGHPASGTVAQGPTAVVSRLLPFSAATPSGQPCVMSSISRPRTKKAYRSSGSQDAKLPPIEAFTFKSFLENTDAQGGPYDVNADLDRIAEICAKSKYSLSNRYEVHCAPHGLGTSFLATASRSDESQGLTLQIVSSDDERSGRHGNKRRAAAKRNSRAMGTLETIISSSRSSDEDKSMKKPAAEIANEVRGRATRKESSHSSLAASSQSSSDGQSAQTQPPSPALSSGKRRASLALIDGSRQTAGPQDKSRSRNSSTYLLSKPALPQASTSQLEIRTAPEEEGQPAQDGVPAKNSQALTGSLEQHMATGSMTAPLDECSSTASFFWAWHTYLPWRSAGASHRPGGRAECSLRDLLKLNEGQGKKTF